MGAITLVMVFRPGVRVSYLLTRRAASFVGNRVETPWHLIRHQVWKDAHAVVQVSVASKRVPDTSRGGSGSSGRDGGGPHMVSNCNIGR